MAHRTAFGGGEGGECSLQRGEAVSWTATARGGEASVPFTEDAFIPSLAAVLQHLVSNADGSESRKVFLGWGSGLGSQERRSCKCVADCKALTPFHAVSAPTISVSAYVARVARYFGCSNECFVLALVYMDRIIRRNATFRVCLRNIHRLLLAAVMVAAKFFDDTYYSNRHYAKVGGVRVAELNLLEAQFLSLLAFDLFVPAEEYNRYRSDVLAAFGLPPPRPSSPWTRLSNSESPSSASSASQTCVGETKDSAGVGCRQPPCGTEAKGGVPCWWGVVDGGLQRKATTLGTRAAAATLSFPERRKQKGPSEMVVEDSLTPPPPPPPRRVVSRREVHSGGEAFPSFKERAPSEAPRLRPLRCRFFAAESLAPRSPTLAASDGNPLALQRETDGWATGSAVKSVFTDCPLNQSQNPEPRQTASRSASCSSKRRDLRVSAGGGVVFVSCGGDCRSTERSGKGNEPEGLASLRRRAEFCQQGADNARRRRAPRDSSCPRPAAGFFAAERGLGWAGDKDLEISSHAPAGCSAEPRTQVRQMKAGAVVVRRRVCGKETNAPASVLALTGSTRCCSTASSVSSPSPSPRVGVKAESFDILQKKAALLATATEEGRCAERRFLPWMEGHQTGEAISQETKVLLPAPAATSREGVGIPLRQTRPRSLLPSPFKRDCRGRSTPFVVGAEDSCTARRRHEGGDDAPSSSWRRELVSGAPLEGRFLRTSLTRRSGPLQQSHRLRLTSNPQHTHRRQIQDS